MKLPHHVIFSLDKILFSYHPPSQSNDFCQPIKSQCADEGGEKQLLPIISCLISPLPPLPALTD